jgi:hypothetical protein
MNSTNRFDEHCGIVATVSPVGAVGRYSFGRDFD